MDLYLGLFVGLVLGGGLTLLWFKVKGLFGGSELKDLRRENRELSERLEKKDRYIEEMLSHAHNLAENIGTMKPPKGESSDKEG
jgi:hypothetical protein